MRAEAPSDVIAGKNPFSIEDVVRLARGDCKVFLNPEESYRRFLENTHAWLTERHLEDAPVYGVSTGVGAAVKNAIPERLRSQMPLNLLRFHGVGTGEILSEDEAAACVAARLASLSRGYSGVRQPLLERLCLMLNERLLPRIPCEGSVGASGDLTPLSYLASALVGEREVSLRGEVMDAARAHVKLGIEPLHLQAKESLSVMNGTSIMTGLACLAFEKATDLARLASGLSAMTSESVLGNPDHFDSQIFALKPHPGSQLCARWIREHLGREKGRPVARLQDRYSIRCAPQVVGVLIDALSFSREMLEVEVNGVNDNPLIDAEEGRILHGGNFYGGHVCFVMDALKNAVANVSDLLDRQMCLLCSSETSGDLPDNLVAMTGSERVVHHGFKAMHISASALTAEALKLTMPASAFSRSTESHNQDKVSMGTIAARECLRALELTETVGAILLLANCQALDLRNQKGAGATTRAIHETVRRQIPMVTVDRRQDLDIETVLKIYREKNLPGLGD
ncbi:MAG: histidine ammonia-lyase [Deltaproteobacteria bacterium]|nr:histidine ammonia-lyase [Deltaproteobacteria bacterium]